MEAQLGEVFLRVLALHQRVGRRVHPVVEPGQQVLAVALVVELEPDVVATVLALMDLAWKHACQHSDVNSNALEVPMTERLRDGMRLQSDAWGRPIVVLPGTESRSTPGVLIPDGRTDIPLMIIPIIISVVLS